MLSDQQSCGVLGMFAGRRRPTTCRENIPDAAPFPISDRARLCSEPRLVRSISPLGARSRGAARNAIACFGLGSALFCTAGAVAWVAHRPVSRSIWLHVALRMAPGAHLFGAGVV